MSLSVPNINASSVVSTTGIIIRYTFYLVGLLVLGLIGIAILTISNYLPARTDATPAFRIDAPDLARLPVKSTVAVGGKIGRAEMREYGRIFGRERDMTVILSMPPKNALVAREFRIELRRIQPLRNARAVFSSHYHDLETRFGEIRAAEMRVDNDGQWKQCLAFVSRFDTDAFSLTGWYCDASGARPNPYKVACLLDRLVLDTRLDSPEADAFLRARLDRPASCTATPVSQTTDTRARASKPKRLR